MSVEFERHKIQDFGLKLAHLEGLLGAYLPVRVFDSVVQQNTIGCDKSAFSRLRSGRRNAVNWELARFIELFDLASHGFDYRVFLLPFDEFDAKLCAAGVGSHGASAAHRLRETLRASVTPGANISIRRDRKLNVGGIGGADEDAGLMRLGQRDKVTLRVPLGPNTAEADHLLLLHDFPDDRATSCLMPSIFAPEPRLTGQILTLPQIDSGHLTFPVGGKPGYRCLYGIQSATNLANFIGLDCANESIPDVQGHQVALLVDYLKHVHESESRKIHVSFGEYLLT